MVLHGLQMFLFLLMILCILREALSSSIFAHGESGWYKQQLGIISSCYLCNNKDKAYELAVSTISGSIALLSISDGKIIWRRTSEQGYYIDKLFGFENEGKHILVSFTKKLDKTLKHPFHSNSELDSVNVVELKNGQILYSETQGYGTPKEKSNSQKRIFDKDAVRGIYTGTRAPLMNNDNLLLDGLHFKDNRRNRSWLILLTVTFVKVVNLEDYTSSIYKLKPATVPFKFFTKPRKCEELDPGSKNIIFTIVTLTDSGNIGTFVDVHFDPQKNTFEHSETIVKSFTGNYAPVDYRIGDGFTAELYHNNNSYTLVINLRDSIKGKLVKTVLEFRNIEVFFDYSFKNFHNCLVIYRESKDDSGLFSYKTTILTFTDKVKQYDLDGMWTILSSDKNLNQYIILNKETDVLMFKTIDVGKEMLVSGKKVHLVGSYHKSSQILYATLFDVPLEQKSTEIIVISFSDGLFQLYKNGSLLWERDESMSLVISSLIAPISNLAHLSDDIRDNRFDINIDETNFRNTSFANIFGVYFFKHGKINHNISVLYCSTKNSIRLFLNFLKNKFSIKKKASTYLNKFTSHLLLSSGKKWEDALNMLQSCNPNNLYEQNTGQDGDINLSTKKNDKNFGNEIIIIVLTSLNKIIAINDVCGTVLWSKSLNDVKSARYSFYPLDFEMLLSNNNGRTCRSGYTVNMLDNQEIYVDQSPIIGYKDSCNIFLVGKAVLCSTCNFIQFGSSFSIIKWILIANGSIIREYRLSYGITCVLPLWSDLSQSDNSALENTLLLLDDDKRVKILNPRGIYFSNEEIQDIIENATIKNFLKKNQITIVIKQDEDSYCGYKIIVKNDDMDPYREVASTEKLWDINFSNSGMRVVAVASPEHQSSSIQPITVLSNFKVYEKYTSQNSIIFITRRVGIDNVVTMLHLVDTLHGKIVYEEILEDDLSFPINISYHENTINLHYWNKKQLRYILHTVDLFSYEHRSLAKTILAKLLPIKGCLQSKCDIRSLVPIVYSRNYILPFGVRAMGMSTTHQSVTEKSLIFASTANQIISIPKCDISAVNLMDDGPDAINWLSSQVSNRYHSVEEPVFDPRRFISLKSSYTISQNIVNIRGIMSVSTMLESSSLVFLFGLDVATIYLQPSGDFDRLRVSFFHYIIYIAIMVLTFILVLKSTHKYKNAHREHFECQ